MKNKCKLMKSHFGRKGMLIYLSAFLFMISSCSDQTESDDSAMGSIIPAVEAVKARYGSLPLTQRLSGIVEAKNQVEIYPELNAVIVDVFVKNGDFVKKGQPLLRLRDTEFKERLKQAQAGYQIALAQQKQAEAAFEEAKSGLTRVQVLAKQGLASPTELESSQTRAISEEADVALAKARVEQARATVDERKETLSQTIIRSPISGSVGNRNAEIGMLVTSSTRLFTLGQLNEMRVKVVLTDRMLNYIREGQRVEILNENALGGVINAELSRISPFLNPVTHSTEAEIDLANPDRLLKSGMFVPVDVFYGESEQATLVPLSALYENPTTGATGVFFTAASFNQEAVVSAKTDQAVALSEPADFEFVPVDVIAKGRMEAGIRGISAGKWVITLGQNLLGSDKGSARVRPVKWTWVEKLQMLQREDLMDELVQKQLNATGDTVRFKNKKTE